MIIQDNNEVPKDESLLWKTSYKTSKLVLEINNLNDYFSVAGILHYCLLGNRTKRDDYSLEVYEETVCWSDSGGTHIGHCYEESELDEVLHKAGVNPVATGYHWTYEYKGLTFFSRSKVLACLRVTLNSDVMTLPEQVKFDGSTIYSAYLQSDLWRAKADAIKAAASNKCSKCDNTKRLHCHHLTYDRLGQELPTDLLCVCESCHKAIHGKKSY